jgi:mRNA interferase RelE/StbE
MAFYNVLIMPSAEKDFKRIPKIERAKILKRINSLALNPRPHGCEKLTGQNR